MAEPASCNDTVQDTVHPKFRTQVIFDIGIAETTRKPNLQDEALKHLPASTSHARSLAVKTHLLTHSLSQILSLEMHLTSMYTALFTFYSFSRSAANAALEPGKRTGERQNIHSTTLSSASGQMMIRTRYKSP